MGKYLKKFDTHSEYESYITSSDKILPNVSYCEDNNDVHYNPWTDPRVIAKFNVEDETEPVALYGNDYGAIASELFSKVEIDGEEVSISDLDDIGGFYTFETTGEHTVKYTLLDSEVIGDGAFNYCSNLTSITIPSGVTSIGEEAFSGCSGLTSINIPNSVTTIGESAFSSCSGFTSITIPSSLTSIGVGAFYYCSGLKSMSVESGNTVYDSRNNCNAIIETATNTLLYGCKNTIIPNSVTSIGYRAFFMCSSLTSINIPNGVTSIDDGAFDSCSSLTTIEMSNSVTSIGERSFYNCTSLTSINISSSVTSIGNGAFQGCSGLTSMNIPSGVTSIGFAVFAHCSGLTSITIPNSVTTIGIGTFQYCSGLTSITIPSSVTNIGRGAFDECSNLASITSLVITAPTIQSDTFISIKTGGTLYVPSGSTGYDVWMGTGNYYLGKYNWTKVEQ